MLKTFPIAIALLLLVGFFVIPSYAVDKEWSIDMELAQSEAEASDKDIFLYFTGSDWCAPCMYMKDKILTTDTFLSAVPQSFVLVEIDFPRTFKLPSEQLKQNDALAEKYFVEYFPTILLADADGRPYATMREMMVSPEEYVEYVQGRQLIRAERDRAFSEAELLVGTAKASALDRGLQAMGMEIALRYYPETIDEIVALDSDNSLGLREGYELALMEMAVDAETRDAIRVYQEGYLADAAMRFERILAQYPLPGGEAQVLRATLGQIYYEMGRKDKSRLAFQQAIKDAPDSAVVPQIKTLMDRIE
ncbi:thioredoxin family protein [Algisphaera agarilytica]|uniref:Thioredoxin-related protein n=1 Tax=Algisphaera agarilytica TaxID=1385975 RepID=A0A7X0H7R3_9BACT|nr:thioredoxin family protein [Algisphaera agarilytica]MBB6430819.1 thioredoxin-related protein [Algisphaera agarilytica]